MSNKTINRQVSEKLVERLNAASLSQSLTASRRYLPRTNIKDLEDGIKVDFIEMGIERDKLNRGGSNRRGTWQMIVVVDMYLQAMITPQDETQAQAIVDGLDLLREEAEEFLIHSNPFAVQQDLPNETLTRNSLCETISTMAIRSHEHAKADGIFLSVSQIRWKVL